MFYFHILDSNVNEWVPVKGCILGIWTDGVTSQILGVPLTTRQPAETCGYRVSQYHTHLSQFIETYSCIFISQIYKNI